jgi:hypothetical protein
MKTSLFDSLGFPSEGQFFKHDNFFVYGGPKLPFCSITLDKKRSEQGTHLLVRAMLYYHHAM